ncbi:hypothetical protein RJT34_30492 [Clitoria ternatea]|uniref:CASP-like protein n=1 Tax=Clitoria ternatea TaxID=43366 RepID=A0AAN9ET70_CLITE
MHYQGNSKEEDEESHAWESDDEQYVQGSSSATLSDLIQGKAYQTGMVKEEPSNVPPVILLRFLREHKSEWADSSIDAYSTATIKAGSCSLPGLEEEMMDSGKKGSVSAVTMVETKANEKGKGVTWAVPVSVDSSVFTKDKLPKWKKGIAITDFMLRLGVIGAAMGSAVTMGTNEEMLSFFTQFLQFHAQWNNFPMFQFFVVANGVVSGYSILALPFSYVCIVRPNAVGPRLLLFTFDTVMMGLITASASMAAAIVYVGHNGSREANWMAFCQGFTNFCQVGSEAVVISFVGAIFLLSLVLLSPVALIRN